METHGPHLQHNPGKRFRHYVYEFFMLFLAVSLGFFVENLREHYVEKNRAYELAASLFEDLKKDTIALHSAINFSERKINASGNMLIMLHHFSEGLNDTAFYENMVSIISSSPLISSDGTYNQMRSSGALRYFDQSLVNLMNAYDVQLKKSKFRDETEDKAVWVLGDFMFDIINLEVVSDIRFDRPISHKIYLKVTNDATADKLINLVVTNRIFRTRTLQEYNAQLEIADHLLEALKKEYHL